MLEIIQKLSDCPNLSKQSLNKYVHEKYLIIISIWLWEVLAYATNPRTSGNLVLKRK